MAEGKSSLISTIIGSICIILYITAIAFGAFQIIISINDRRSLSEQEFNDLADRASSAAILGFMSQAYQESLMDALEESQTLLGTIISGSNGQYGLERRSVNVINWAGNSPRFKSGFGFPNDPYHRVIRIDGQRNGTIQAQYTLIDFDFFIHVLKQTLAIILGSLVLAILALLIEILMKNFSSGKPVPVMKTAADYSDFAPVEIITESGTENHSAPLPEKDKPQGLYSPRSNVGWESYTRDRLASELHRCASSEQDLAFLNIKYQGENNDSQDDSIYRELADETVKFFSHRDLVFEKGGCGLSVIIPGSGLEQGIIMSEEFLRRMQKRFPGAFGAGLRIGLSSRSGRLVEAERLIFESSQALLKAEEDPVSPIVAFKSDPQKYRDFISKR